MMADVGWDDDRTAELKRLWAAGKSASEIVLAISTKFFRPSRNAVIGKVHRIGLSGRGRTMPAASAHLTRPTRTYIAPTPPKPRPAAGPVYINQGAVKERSPDIPLPPMPVETMTATATLMTIERGECRWPIGDPLEDDFGFCGREQLGRGPYCEHHAALVSKAPKRPMTAKEYERSLRYFVSL